MVQFFRYRHKKRGTSREGQERWGRTGAGFSGRHPITTVEPCSQHAARQDAINLESCQRPAQCFTMLFSGSTAFPAPG